RRARPARPGVGVGRRLQCAVHRRRQPHAGRPRSAEVLRLGGHQHHRPRQLRRADAHRAAVVAERGRQHRHAGLSLRPARSRIPPMTTTSLTRRRFASTLGALACMPGLAAGGAAALPGDSVYQLRATLTDHHGRAFELASLRGAPVLVTMFYTSCEMVCPMLFETIRFTLDALPVAQRSGARVLMVSFDPARDTVPVLAQTARTRGCDERWTLARCDERTAREIAAALGLQYRRLDSG